MVSALVDGITKSISSAYLSKDVAQYYCFEIRDIDDKTGWACHTSLNKASVDGCQLGDQFAKLSAVLSV